MPMRKKLLILDVNGLLVDTCFIGDSLKTTRTPDGISGRFQVFNRPYCREFLEFCLQNFAVGVWSSSRQYNVDGLVAHIFGVEAEKLAFVWGQSECTNTGIRHPANKHKPVFLKELSKVWDNPKGLLKWEPKFFGPHNTVLLDDSPYKGLKNPPDTGIYPPTYEAQQEEDDMLGPKGGIYLYLRSLLRSTDVQKFISDHPFGQKLVPLLALLSESTGGGTQQAEGAKKKEKRKKVMQEVAETPPLLAAGMQGRHTAANALQRDADWEREGGVDDGWDGAGAGAGAGVGVGDVCHSGERRGEGREREGYEHDRLERVPGWGVQGMHTRWADAESPLERENKRIDVGMRGGGYARRFGGAAVVPVARNVERRVASGGTQNHNQNQNQKLSLNLSNRHLYLVPPPAQRMPPRLMPGGYPDRQHHGYLFQSPENGRDIPGDRYLQAAPPSGSRGLEGWQQGAGREEEQHSWGRDVPKRGPGHYRSMGAGGVVAGAALQYTGERAWEDIRVGGRLGGYAGAGGRRETLGGRNELEHLKYIGRKTERNGGELRAELGGGGVRWQV